MEASEEVAQLLDESADAPDELGKRLTEWAQGLPDWQQDLVARLLSSGTLNDDERADAVSRVLAVYGFDDGRDAPVATTVEDSAFAAYESSSTGSIRSVGQLKSVNGLVAEGVDALEVAAQGATLVYGPNAAGKTGYARTLRYVGRSVIGRPTILPNVRQEGGGASPSAQIEMTIDGDEKAFVVDFTESPPQECAIIRAFDAGAADTYVTNETAVDFTPPVLAIFGRLASEQQVLVETVKGQIATLEALKPELSLDGSVAAREAVAGINPDTDADEFLEQFSVGEGDEEKLNGLRESAQAMGPALDAQIRQETDRASRARAILQQLQQVEAVVSDAAIEWRSELASTALEKTKLAKEVIDTTFDESEQASEAVTAWRVLWDAAEEFFHSVQRHEAAFPPVEGEACPLCAQDLDGDAAERFARFKEFTIEKTAVEAEVAERADREAKSQLSNPLPQLDDDALAELRDLDSDVGALVDAFVSAANARREKLLESDSKDGVPPLPSLPSAELEAFVAARTEKSNQLVELKDEEKREALTAEIVSLAGKHEISTHAEELRAWCGAQSEIAALRKVVQALDTRDVTRSHGEFAKQVINDDFLAQVKKELSGLGLGYLAIDVSNRGEAAVRKMHLEMEDFHVDAKLEDVLSEGERRGLGLACFLAELAVFGGSGPIVLDDPVSSFDYERREEVARRLLDESEERQVVVLTHDVSFTATMNRLAKARKRRIAIRNVRRLQGQPGYVFNDRPHELRTTKERAKDLAVELDQFPDPTDLQPEAYARRVRGWYSELRLLWERAVERDLLNGVATRFDHAIHTQKFNGILVERSDELAVEKGMSRASDRAHEPAPGDTVPVPTLDEMRQDLKDLTDLVATVKKRREEAGFTS